MKFKSAGLTDATEAAIQMMRGKIFYSENGEDKFYFYEKNLSGLGHPFLSIRIAPCACSNEIPKTAWDNLLRWQVEVSWEDEVSEENSVLCYTSDCPIDEFSSAVLRIIGKNRSGYVTRTLATFRYAKPVKPEDCWGYENG